MASSCLDDARPKRMGSVSAEAACEKMNKAFPRKRHGRGGAGPRRSEPHVRPVLFAGRSLSGFVCAEPAGYAADDLLANWVQRALEYVSGLPAKPARTRN